MRTLRSEVPTLRVVGSRQRYTTLRVLSSGHPGHAVIRFRSGRFLSDLEIDSDGFVVTYPSLGRRIDPVSSAGEP